MARVFVSDQTKGEHNYVWAQLDDGRVIAVRLVGLNAGVAGEAFFQTETEIHDRLNADLREV